MSSRRSTSLKRRSIPMSAILPCLTGFGLLLVYYKFPFLLENWGETGRMVFLALSFLQLLWGAKQIFRAYQSGGSAEASLRINRNRVMLPREGFVYLSIMGVLFVGSLLGRSNMLMLVFALMAGPFILNGWVTYTMLQRMKVARTLPERIMAGELLSVQMRLENRKRWFSSWLLSVRDQIENEYEELVTGVVFARIPPGDQRSGQYQIRPMKRGRYQFGPIELSTRFPIGLVERGILMQSEGELLVYPRIGRLTSRWKQLQQQAAELVEQREAQQGYYDDEFHRIREYRHGDSPRNIHWRTSARQSELMVREFEQCRDQDLALVLDLWQSDEPSADSYERIELAVSFAATIALEHLRVNRSSQFFFSICGQETVEWNHSEDTVSLEGLLDTFATLQAGPATDLAQILEKTVSTTTQQTGIILVSTRYEKTLQQIRGQDEVSTTRVRTVFSDRESLAPFFHLS